MKKEIPIRNLYYLLSYTWEFVSRGTQEIVGTDSFANSTNILARLMDATLKDVLKRGVSKEYTPAKEDIPGVRGKISLSRTVMSGRLKYGRALCDFDEFGLNHLLNQIIKASICVLLKQHDLAVTNAVLMRGYLAQFEQVAEIQLAPSLFSKVRLHANTRHYRFVLELCRLIASSLVISSESREVLLSNFLEDSIKMDRIFEKFIKNFYSVHLTDASVGSPRFEWEIQTDDTLFAQRVPELRTDVVIDHGGKRLIIDAKYYVEAMKQNQHGSFKYRRDHLSQLMEYIRTSRRKEDIETRGLLLYPTVDESLDNSGFIEGLPIRVATIDLSRPWGEIEKSLMILVQPSNSRVGSAA